MPRPAEIKPAAFRKSLVAWFKKAGRDLPWRRTADPYAILVSEIMLQQTQVVTVLDYYARWMKRFPDFASLAAASEADVLSVWQGLGYYSRARNLHRAAQAVMREHAGEMPRDPEEIHKLPGIGRYTAGAVATFAFDLPAPIVDANIARVLARVFNIREPVDSTAGRDALWAHAAALQPPSGGRLFNSALMELGALVCLPRSPKCSVCPVKKSCRAPDPESLPVKKARRKTIALEENCAWITRKGRILLEQQTGPRWRGLWKLPATRSPTHAGPLLKLTYPFTHHRVTLAVFSESAPGKIPDVQRWFDMRTIDHVAITAPHRRAINQLAC
ncbi:MAG TPA: A/G-specific adenine glycosylase [Chthoniobacteraceae bacterium]|nr:A/G-specific adenine glycosylase [Chthoniobacteraceae bacterium]